ncbi:MAG: tRNA 2-thiocytidine(32) synthetase TtcA [Bacteroides sp.]|nr:tRNA 2-thiocytidine(32) synthetase TtcA [Bacteroides sp.]
MAQYSEDEKLFRRIERRFSKGVVEYGLIEEGDRILAALSGGKDSLALLELLARRARVFKPRFSVVAAHVVMKNIPYQSDVDYLRDFAASLGVELVVHETEFDATTDRRKSPCFLCSWNRRKALFTVAKELGCNKIALGHHMDDILETLLMNLTFQGAFSTMPPMLPMQKFDMTIIRPMCLVHEADIASWARIRAYHKQVKNCPYETASNRSAMKEVLRRLEELNPEVRYSLWGSMGNVQKELLPKSLKSGDGTPEQDR